MEFENVLYNRHSVRQFTDESVDDETINRIIKAGIYAPSACNFEAWKIIAFKNSDYQKKAPLENDIAIKAPYVFLITYRNDLKVTGWKHHDYIQSASAMMENMLLYIESMNLGGVWLCNLPKDSQLRRAYGIPRNFSVIGCIAFGHPNKVSSNSLKDMEYHYGDEKSFRERKRRFSIDKVLCHEQFETQDGDCTHLSVPKQKNKLKKWIKRIIVKLWIK